MAANLLPSPDQDATPRFYYQSNTLGQVPISQQLFGNIASMASPTMLPVGYFDLLAQGYTMDSSGALHSPQSQNVQLGGNELPTLPGGLVASSATPAAAQPSPVNPLGAFAGFSINPVPPSGATNSGQTTPNPYVRQNVSPMPSAPSQVRQPSQQQSPLMQMFNFPRFRKKPAQSTGAAPQAGVGQYNENFWNAWRL